MCKSVGREENFADALASSALSDGLSQHARRQAVLHHFAIGDNPTRIVIPTERSDRGICFATGHGSRVTSHVCWHGAVPVHSAVVVEAPVDGDPARIPRLQPQLLGPRGVMSNVEDVEVLTGEN